MMQTRGGVRRLRTLISRCAVPKEGSVAKSLRYQARRALLQQTVPQYREASPSHKKTLLDAFVAATGYHRTYARWLLNHAEDVQQTLQRPRPPHTVWARSPTRAIFGLARRQPHLRQTPHSLSPHPHRIIGAA